MVLRSVGIGLVLLMVAILGFSVIRHKTAPTLSPSPISTVTPTSIASLLPTDSATSPVVANSSLIPQSHLVPPVADFKSRITKKFLGTYVTPQNSPVQPERFTGYHTGVDVEYEDVTDDVPVKAIADGTVLKSSWVSGYGGMLVVEHTLEGKPRAVVYGHLDPNRLPKVGSTLRQGDTISYLGKGHTHDTDGERRHLHFAILQTNAINVRGYVATKEALNQWLDPLTFF